MNKENEGATPQEGPDPAGVEMVYQRSPRVLFRRVGEEIIVASAEGDPYLLRETALTIWNLLETARTASELIRELSAAYGVPHAAVSSDVRPFLADLISRGLVDEVGYGHA
jgi:hypothetical protein